MTATFNVSSTFAASVDQVVDALADPEFHLGMRGRSWLEPDRVEAVERTADSLVTLVHYRYVGKLNPKAERFVSPDKLTWVEEMRWDLGSGRMRGGVVVDDADYAKKITAHADGSLAAAGDGSRLEVRGEIKIHGVPLVGGRAEKWLARTFEGHQTRFAEALRERLAAGAG